jgi:hypothetical protein
MYCLPVVNLPPLPTTLVTSKVAAVVFVLLDLWSSLYGFVNHYLHFCSLAFNHYIVCPSICGFYIFGIFSLFL